jgi:transcriptional regulator with XRE-family HTH domain
MLCCMAGSTKSSASVSLGAALRELREAKGISQRKLAEMIGRDSGLYSRWESGGRNPKPDDVAQIVEALGIDDERAAELVKLADDTGKPVWLAVTLPERRQQLNALLRAERTATTVTHVAPLLIPGVMQTTELIRAIMVDGDVPADEIDERVNARVGRRDLITRKNPAQLNVLLGQAAVTQIIGGRQVMAEQLRYLLELGERPNIDLRIVPFESSWSPALSGAFILIDSDEAPSIVNIEMQRSGVILHDPDDIAAHRQSADVVREKAMSPAATAELITEVLTHLEIHDDSTARP